ncbi:Hypothetical protein LUCI_0119 [Lucifera butyrica]|uniref:Uncharacterized protein n=1 Tax=Lucifera butyrica TaxID=1351585 RepID=A0A498R412_9FIRM|nr:Hypothetical protein LUCI_0119 [Lucifera butyrica]
MLALKKLFRAVAVIVVISVVSLFCLIYYARSNYVSDKEYARMEQKIVNQNIDYSTDQNKKDNCLGMLRY